MHQKELGQFAECYLIAHDHRRISVTNKPLQNREVHNKTKKTEELRCFKSNQMEHKAIKCSSNASTIKGIPECYNCNKPGHITRDCTVKKTTSKEIKYAAAALSKPVAEDIDVDKPSSSENGKRIFKGCQTMDIISALC